MVSYALAVPKPVVAFCQLLWPVPHGDGSRGPAAVPKPAEVKARLPAVEYGELVAERLLSSPPPVASPGGEEEAAAAPTCIVCLENVEAGHEVRRLGNCAHAFHRGCIDRWIDQGRATCPLCRSDLLPRPRARARLASLLTRVW